MKFRSTDFPSLVAGLISLLSLMGYAPHMRAEEHPPSGIKPPGFETIYSTVETANDTGKNPGWLVTNQQQENRGFNRETRPQVQGAELLLPLGENRPETLTTPVEIPNDTAQEDWPLPVNDSRTYWSLLIEQFESRNNEGEASFNWEGLGWVGGDYRRLWLKTEGEVALVEDTGGEAEVQLLYGQLVAPFWDVQAGLRYDRLYGSEGDRGRAFAVIGAQGLTPYLFEVDGALFVSEDGDVSARFSAEYKLLLTQRLILQPEFEVNVSAQKVADFGVGSGLNDIDLGLRMRYEITREFAPYAGISWSRKFGETADFAREEGEDVDNFAVVGGLRLLF